MAYYLTTEGTYYEGDKTFTSDIEVPKRPSYKYTYYNDSWQYYPKPEYYETVVQQLLDSTARANGYDSILSVVSYATDSSIPKFEADGKRFSAWRAKVWDHCYKVLHEVSLGRVPPTEEELLQELPILGVV